LSRERRRLYLLLNKPPGYVSTVSDPQHRPTVISLVRDIKERVYPVGRLDYHSSGLMLLTNDGELANFLMAPKSGVPRTYQVRLECEAGAEALRRLEEGIVLDGRRTAPCQIRPLASREKPWYEITLVEGRYHQVRRMFERVGQAVVKLKRVRIAFLTDHDLAPGRFRQLRPAEVNRLKHWKGGRSPVSG
jgi:pseudouridine synthase